jgi:hypothetical protein
MPRLPPTLADLDRELRRQLDTRANTSGVVQDANRHLHRLRSGTLARPDVLVGLALAFAGGTFTLCSGLAAALWAISQR